MIFILNPKKTDKLSAKQKLINLLSIFIINTTDKYRKKAFISGINTNGTFKAANGTK